jgi:ribonuclease HII
MAACNTYPLYDYDVQLCSRLGGLKIIGIDEAGRGPLAGPVVAAAVVLNLSNPIDGINDSKKVPQGKRELLFTKICSQAAAWGVGMASPEEIDTHNILQATFLAMQRALAAAGTAWDIACIDGNQFVPRIEKKRQMPIVKGDGISASIAAASIVAKVTRDRIMDEYHAIYPQWNFLQHKGYPTLLHRTTIGTLGICPIHRKSFCKKFMPAI